MEYIRTQNIQVDRRSNGRKLFQFLEDFLNNQVPKSALMKWIRTGQVRVDGSLNMPFPFIVKIFAAGLIAVSNHKEQEAKSRIVMPQMSVAGGK